MNSAKLTNYEKKRLANLRDNQKLLQDLGIKMPEMNITNKSSSSSIKKKVIKTKTIINKDSHEKQQNKHFIRPLTRAKSGKRNLECTEAEIDMKINIEEKPTAERVPPKKEINIEQNYLKYHQYDVDKNNQKEIKDEKRNIGNRNQFSTNNDLFFKIIPSRITALNCFTFDYEKLFAFCGDKFGNFTIFYTKDINKLSNELLDSYDIAQYNDMHSEAINSIDFDNKSYNNDNNNNKMNNSSLNITHIFTSSFDNTIRVFDFVGMKNLLVADLSEEKKIIGKLSSMKHVSNHQFSLIGSAKGILGTIDFRSGKLNSSYAIGKKRIYGFSQHPHKSHLFCVSNGESVDIFDIRKLNSALQNVAKSTLSIPSSEFSKINGNTIALLGYNNFISTYSFDESENCELIATTKHNNNTGRWLSRFRCEWMPVNCDNDYNNDSDSNCKFITGSLEFPRRIDVFDRNCQYIDQIGLEQLNYVCSINSFDASGNFLISGNSSGKITILKNH